MTLTRESKTTIALIAVGMSLYHLYVAFIGAPQAFFFRGTHLLFAMTLVFQLYPSFVEAKQHDRASCANDRLAASSATSRTRRGWTGG